MNRSFCCFAAVAFFMAAMPLAAQQEVPMRGNTPRRATRPQVAAAAGCADPI